MTDFEKKLLEEITSLRAEMAAMREEFSLSRITYFENLPPSAVVSTDYAAYRFGCSESAVLRGRFETYRIPRFRDKPIKFIKREVDRVFAELNRPTKEKASEIRYRAKQKQNGVNNL